MKKILFPILLTLSLSNLFAQISPEIKPDGTVTFRIQAPNANEVVVKGQIPKVVLEKKDNKRWEGTTKTPIKPGIYEYSFWIDGVRNIDTRNPIIKPQRWPNTSLLHIQSSPLAHWDLAKIPHGTIHKHDYYSNTLKKWRKLVVYTPPVTLSNKQKLPVLYLSHGFSDNQEAWTVTGKAHWILDSLIQKKMAKPMIIVMPDAHPLDPEGEKYENYAPQNTQVYATEMMTDILPFVEANYPVIQKTSGRAFAGLSMGGGHAFTMAFQYPEHFSQIGAFSAATPPIDILEGSSKLKEINKHIHLFWVACGDKDFLFDRNQKTHAWMSAQEIHHDYVVTEGDNHSWPVWRRYLVQFLPKLF